MGLPSLRGECLLVAFLLHAFFGVAVDLASMFDYGNQLYKNGSLIEATKVYRNVLSVEENHTEALCNLGTTFVDLNRIDEAVPLFQKALQRASPHINAFSGMGVIKMKQGKLEESLRFFFHAAVICSVERTLSTSGVIQYEQTMANLGLVITALPQHAFDCTDSLRRAEPAWLVEDNPAVRGRFPARWLRWRRRLR